MISTHLCVVSIEWMDLVLSLWKEASSVNAQFFHAAYGTCLGNLLEGGPSLKAALVCDINHILSLGHVPNVFVQCL